MLSMLLVPEQLELSFGAIKLGQKAISHLAQLNGSQIEGLGDDTDRLLKLTLCRSGPSQVFDDAHGRIHQNQRS